MVKLRTADSIDRTGSVGIASGGTLSDDGLLDLEIFWKRDVNVDFGLGADLASANFWPLQSVGW